MNEVFLGFHLRKTIGQTDRIWDLGNRAMYLLREEIAFPLSVDEAVWPDCEDAQLLSSLFYDYSQEPFSCPNGLGVYCDVNPTILDRSSIYDGAFLIGITVVNGNIDTADNLMAKHGIHNITFSLEQLDMAGWECLGYDVADEWLLSGLMNCSYSPSEKPSYIQNYASGLNEYGLFTSIKDAQRFLIDCESSAPEHVPFAVYGIWANGRP